MLKSKLVIGALQLLAALPLGMLRLLGGTTGLLLWSCRSRARRITEINVARCLPHLSAAERRRLVRASLVDLGKTAAEILKVWFGDPARVLGTIRAIEGEQLLQQKLAAGGGVVLLAPHHGNWELLGMYLGRRYGITSMYLPGKDPEFDALVHRVRSRDGATLVPADGSGVRSLLKALRQGRLIGVLPDQEPKRTGADFAPFFETPALTMTLISNLLQRTRASAIMAYALRVPGGFRLVFREPEAELYAESLPVSLAGLNRSVERCALDHPEQYQWEYKRFKKQPPECKEPY
ncbi:MAG: lysophospholipid acyltransferase family protein [Spongiibacteraceae bacterium]|jgi:KDO2-lipid IV(A) lauroyltransferase|nr:lysophospholipid acyltransferase family protein [Spongiibacteraceae bacterium]